MNRFKKAKTCKGILLDRMNKQKQQVNCGILSTFKTVVSRNNIYQCDSMGAEDLFLLRLLQLFTTSGRHRRLEAEEGRKWHAAPIIPLYSSFLKQMIGQQMKPTLLSNQRLAQYSWKIFQKSSVWIKYERTCEPERRTGSGAVGGISAGSVWTRVAFLLWRFIVISKTSKNGSDERSSCSQLTKRLSSSITFLTCCKEKKNHCGALSGSKQQRA